MRLAHDDTGGGPAVVLVHGHPFDRSIWRATALALSRAGFRAVVPDLRGFGDSPVTPGTVLMATLADDVLGLLDDLGVRSAAVVGLSMGGLVAMEMALAEPARVWALGLVASTAEPVEADEARWREELAGQVEREGIEPLVQRMLAGLFGPACRAETREAVCAMMRRCDPMGAAAALRGRARRPDYAAALPALRLPAFVCAGEADPWCTPAVTEAILAALPGARALRMPGVGHLPQLECPERFTTELRDFLFAAHGLRVLSGR